MSESAHPFSDGRIADVADEHGVDEGELDGALADVQRAMSRDRRESVAEQFAEGLEPLAVANTGDEPPLFGQDV